MKPSERARESKYNWCPECHELWVAERMARLGVSVCPLCETPVVAPPVPKLMNADHEQPGIAPPWVPVWRRARGWAGTVARRDVSPTSIAERSRVPREESARVRQGPAHSPPSTATGSGGSPKQRGRRRRLAP